MLVIQLCLRATDTMLHIPNISVPTLNPSPQILLVFCIFQGELDLSCGFHIAVLHSSTWHRLSALLLLALTLSSLSLSRFLSLSLSLSPALSLSLAHCLLVSDSLSHPPSSLSLSHNAEPAKRRFLHFFSNPFSLSLSLCLSPPSLSCLSTLQALLTHGAMEKEIIEAMERERVKVKKRAEKNGV